MKHVVLNYLNYLDIPISKKYFEKLIYSHSDYPSLLSIADTLDRLGISYEAARVAREDLVKLSFPYLFKPDQDGKEFTFIKEQKDLSLANEPDSEYSHAIVFQAEPTDTIMDEENQKQRSEETFLKISSIALLSALSGLLLLSSVQFIFWIQASLLITAVAGAVVSYLLVAKDIGITYESLEAFCKSGEKTNCDAILYSDAAKVFGNVTFSDVAASYFLFQLLMVGFLLPLSGDFLLILFVLTILTVPVIGYSLYYQAVKAKTWCRLCHLVDAVLILQAALFGYIYYEGMIQINTDLLPVIQAGLLFVATSTSVLLLKNRFKAANQSRQAEIAANRIKYTPDVFLPMLFREKAVNTSPFEQELLIGEAEAPIKIIMAGSLSCGPCKKGFKQAVKLVATYPNSVNLAIRLRTHYGGSNDSSSASTWLLSYWLHHIYGKPDASSRTEILLWDWYNLMDLEKFKEQYPLQADEMESKEIETLEARHSNWTEMEDISRTPTFFINGWRLPNPYRIDNLMGLVPALTDHFENEMVPSKILTDVVKTKKG